MQNIEEEARMRFLIGDKEFNITLSENDVETVDGFADTFLLSINKFKELADFLQAEIYMISVVLPDKLFVYYEFGIFNLIKKCLYRISMFSYEEAKAFK